jgi:hypothetical protein
MRDHGYDLTSYLRAQWPAIGPGLLGKLHVYVGDMDHFYLNLAVYKLDEFLSATRDPHDSVSVQYGRPLKGHGQRPTTTGDMLRWMADEITMHAPPGQVTDAWRYH